MNWNDTEKRKCFVCKHFRPIDRMEMLAKLLWCCENEVICKQYKEYDKMIQKSNANNNSRFTNTF